MHVRIRLHFIVDINNIPNKINTSIDNNYSNNQLIWIPGSLPVDSAAALHASSKPPEVPGSVPCWPEIPTHLGVSFAPQAHKR